MPDVATLANNQLPQPRDRNDQKNFETEVQRLAGLSTLEFEREFKNVADKFGIRPSKLEEQVRAKRKDDQKPDQAPFEMPDPWSDPVNGAELLQEIREVLLRHCILPEGADLIIGLWILFAHTHDAYQVSPILALQSPEKRCGKTTLLEVVGGLVPKPMMASHLTPAVLFRSIDMFGPTLLLDEADTFVHGNEELRGAINAGHKKRTSKIFRCIGDEFEPKGFSVWGPKVIAGIEGAR